MFYEFYLLTLSPWLLFLSCSFNVFIHLCIHANKANKKELNWKLYQDKQFEPNDWIMFQINKDISILWFVIILFFNSLTSKTCETSEQQVSYFFKNIFFQIGT